MENTPTVKFVPNLEQFFGIRGMCIPWIHEIHVDERYRDTKRGSMIIQHELKHYHLAWKYCNENRKLRRAAILVYNNLWDTFDVVRIEVMGWLRRG